MVNFVVFIAQKKHGQRCEVEFCWEAEIFPREKFVLEYERRYEVSPDLHLIVRRHIIGWVDFFLPSKFWQNTFPSAVVFFPRIMSFALNSLSICFKASGAKHFVRHRRSENRVFSLTSLTFKSLELNTLQRIGQLLSVFQSTTMGWQFLSPQFFGGRTSLFWQVLKNRQKEIRRLGLWERKRYSFEPRLYSKLKQILFFSDWTMDDQFKLAYAMIFLPKSFRFVFAKHEMFANSISSWFLKLTFRLFLTSSAVNLAHEGCESSFPLISWFWDFLFIEIDE